VIASVPANVCCVLFDAVGTLIYPNPPVAEAYQAVARQLGLDLSATEIARRFVAAFAREFAASGLSRPPTSEAFERDRWRRIVAGVLTELSPADEAFERLWRHFAQPVSWRVFDDVSPTFSDLASRGLCVGIASNFDNRLHGIVHGVPALSACTRTFVSSEIGYSKPDPRFFAAVAAQLGLPAEEIMLVGDDRVNDYEGALAAGWQAVLVERGAPSG
jgi:putative hydrolase of the HAD superfamily